MVSSIPPTLLNDDPIPPGTFASSSPRWPGTISEYRVSYSSGRQRELTREPVMTVPIRTHSPYPMLTVAEATHEILSRLEPLAPVTLDFRDAAGYVLAEDVRSGGDLPPARRERHHIQEVSRAANVHAEDFIAIFLLERQRRCTMPDLVGLRGHAFQCPFAQAQKRL